MAPNRRSGRRSAAGATTPVETPSPDVVFEILSWLPAISLTRFRCVCTSWRAMISDPTFLAVHRSRVEPLLVAVTNYDCSPTETTSMQIMDTDGYTARFLDVDGLWKLQASVDGLILLASRNHSCPAVRVINLATMETVVNFPRPARAADHVWFGFGRAAWSGTLKIIRIVFRSLSIIAADHIATCEILTLGEEGGSSGWRETGSPPAKICDSYDCLDGVTVKGVLHFLFKSQDDILCFDLESEVWTVIRGPRAGSPSPLEKIGLAELNDTLCATHTKQCTVNLWLLTDHNKDVWVKAYTISVNHDVGFVPLRVRPDGKLLFYYRRDSMGLTPVLYVYDPRSGICAVLENGWDGILGRIGLCSTRLCGQP